MGSEDKLWELLLPCVCFRLSGEGLYLLSRLAGRPFSFPSRLRGEMGGVPGC